MRKVSDVTGSEGKGSRGVGGEVIGIGGRTWGLVVGEDRRSWHLESGRAARKAHEGLRWRWATDAATCLDSTSGDGGRSECRVPEPDSEASITSSPPSLCTSPQFAPWAQSSPNLSPGMSPLCGRSGSLSDWMLPGPSEALIVEMAGENGELQDSVLPAAGKISPVVVDHEGAAGLPETVVVGICEALRLPDVVRLTLACKMWRLIMRPHLPLELSPSQVDAFLRVCLLEVLVAFDDSRLPLAMSAVYHEMRVAGKRLAACPRGLALIEAHQQDSLGDSRPHHVAWRCDVKLSKHKTLERMAKHFHTEKLIHCGHQQWRKRIHHSPNARTCKELCLTLVHRGHPLFLEHARWSQNAEHEM